MGVRCHGRFRSGCTLAIRDHSYAMFHVHEEADEDTVMRCISEAQRAGVGLVLFTKPEAFDT